MRLLADYPPVVYKCLDLSYQAEKGVLHGITIHNEDFDYDWYIPASNRRTVAVCQTNRFRSRTSRTQMSGEDLRMDEEFADWVTARGVFFENFASNGISRFCHFTRYF